MTCHPSTPCAARLKTLNPSTALRERENLTLHRAGITTPPGQESDPESTGNQTLITARIGRPLHPGFREWIAGEDGKAALQIGAARTQPTAKEKLSEHPGNLSSSVRPSPAPGSCVLAAVKRQRQVLCSAVRSASHAQPVLYFSPYFG